MTVQEMIDIINYSNSAEDFSFCYTLEKLIDCKNIEEAVVCIQKRFNCNQEIANNVLIEFKRQIYDEVKKIRKENQPSPQQIAHANAVAREWQNKPKCPTCGSTDVKKISTLSKVAGASMFGLFSKTARSQFKCNNCGYKW